MNQTDRWVKVVALAMRQLTPEKFQQWIVLVGGGHDEERAMKGERFLEMMRPTHYSHNEFAMNLIKESQP